MKTALRIRHFPCLLVLGVIAVGTSRAVPAAPGKAKAAALDQLRVARGEAAHRQRRIIFNNDGNEPVYYCDQVSAESLLQCRTTPLVGSQVDAIFYCTWSSPFGCFTHDTKAGTLFTCTEKGFSKNKTREFIDRGLDPLKIMVDFGKQHGIEIFWSMRMNDTHDAWGGWYGPLMFAASPLKREHPEWLIATAKKRGKCGGWTAVDFARGEIRDLTLKYFEEVCRNYDVDGVEMDFFRHPVFFKSHAMGGSASQAECDLMTGLVGRIRRMTEEVGLERGRPILVAARVPDNPDYAKAIGLDVTGWMEDGLIDILTVSGYFRLNPWKASAAWGHQYGVPVYAGLSETRLGDKPAAKVRATVECYRGRAANVWNSGLDGVYLFNSFNPRSPLWRQLGDPRTLAGRDKVYTTGARGVNVVRSWKADGDRYLNRQIVSPERPLTLAPGDTATVELQVGENPSEAKNARVTLRLRTSGLDDAGALTAALDGRPLTAAEGSAAEPEFAVPPQLLRRGANPIRLGLAAGAKTPAKIVDLQLWVRYQK